MLINKKGKFRPLTETVILYRLNDNGELQEIKTDDISKSLVIMELEHHRIHEGNAFRANHYLSLGASATVYYQFKIGENYVHFKERSLTSSTTDVLFSVIENPTVTIGTTAIPIYNAKRNGTRPSTVSFFSNPGTPSGGSTTDRELMVASNQSAQRAVNSIEWVYSPGNNYIVKLENLENQATNILIKYFWYET